MEVSVDGNHIMFFAVEGVNVNLDLSLMMNSFCQREEKNAQSGIAASAGLIAPLLTVNSEEKESKGNWSLF